MPHQVWWSASTSCVFERSKLGPSGRSLIAQWDAGRHHMLGTMNKQNVMMPVITPATGGGTRSHARRVTAIGGGVVHWFELFFWSCMRAISRFR